MDCFIDVSVHSFPVSMTHSLNNLVLFEKLLDGGIDLCHFLFRESTVPAARDRQQLIRHSGFGQAFVKPDRMVAVSYTHLTLPTIYSV